MKLFQRLTTVWGGAIIPLTDKGLRYPVLLGDTVVNRCTSKNKEIKKINTFTATLPHSTNIALGAAHEVIGLLTKLCMRECMHEEYLTKHPPLIARNAYEAFIAECYAAAQEGKTSHIMPILRDRPHGSTWTRIVKEAAIFPQELLDSLENEISWANSYFAEAEADALVSELKFFFRNDAFVKIDAFKWDSTPDISFAPKFHVYLCASWDDHRSKHQEVRSNY